MPLAFLVQLVPHASFKGTASLGRMQAELEKKLNGIAASVASPGSDSEADLVKSAVSGFIDYYKDRVSSVVVTRGADAYGRHGSDGWSDSKKPDSSADAGSVIKFGAKGDGVTDDTAAFLAALASEAYVTVPTAPVFYKITGPITVPAGKELVGIGAPLLKYSGTVGNIGVVQSGGDGCSIVNLTIDGGNTNNPMTPFSSVGVKVSHQGVLVDSVKVINGRSRGVWFVGATQSIYRHGSSKSNTGPGLAVEQCVGCQFIDLDLSLNLSNFGCYVFESHYNLFENLRALNKGTGNVSLELMGMTYSCTHNKIIDCRAEGTGDNGISVTGSDNVVMGNHAESCKHAGIYLYGSRNVCVGNHCENNNQRYTGDNTAKFAGIMVQSSWGGLGMHNTVAGNTCVDTQAVHTQYAAVRLANHSYSVYAANTAYTTNSYVYNGLNVYKCVQAGTSAVGGVAPTHTTGDVTDGTVIWRFVTTGDTNLNPKYNSVSGTISLGNLNTGVLNETTSAANTIVDAGSIEIAMAGSASVSTKILAGQFSPVSPGTAAPIGSLFLRNGGGPGITAYVKEESGDTKWTALVTRRSGPTASRPTLSGTGYDGFMYYDTTLGKPVWFKGSDNTWHLADGTAA